MSIGWHHVGPGWSGWLSTTLTMTLVLAAVAAALLALARYERRRPVQVRERVIDRTQKGRLVPRSAGGDAGGAGCRLTVRQDVPRSPSDGTRR